eukprot:TRINITY_DN1354_c0_g4_i1.p1 TRINITY_DN1354_c0_g4~~TRINITY_DN1354_c0_g4_i1.p1  ORF type:complete len:1661 (+),score=570.77 TRINITY_DN1354_c0_g4_i1:16-4998(+)
MSSFGMALAAAAVFGGVPECANTHSRCMFSYNPLFSDLVQNKFDGNYGFILSERRLMESFCHMDNWIMKSEVCGGCPYDLILTQGVPEKYLGRRLCLTGTSPSPFRPQNHMHIAHPLNGKELTFFNPNSSRACTPSSYPAGDLSSHAAVVGYRQGSGNGCSYSAAAKHIANAGVALQLTVLDGYYSYFRENRAHFFSPKISDDLGDLVMFSAHNGKEVPLMELLEKASPSSPVKGKVVYNCGKGIKYANPAEADFSEYAGDQCPWWFQNANADEMCGTMSDPRDRLCKKCPLTASDPSNGGKLACLWAPDVLPTRKHHLLSRSINGTQKVSVIYIDDVTKRNGLCSGTDFDPTWAGRIVAFSPTVSSGACARMDTLISAQDAGVSGIIVVTDKRVQGVGYNLHTPVACGADSADVTALTSFFRGGTPLGGVDSGVFEREVNLESIPWVTDAPTPSPPAPIDPVVDPIPDNGSMTDEVGVILGIVLIPLLVIAIVAKLVHARMTTVPFPDGSSGISLSTGSTLLSLGMAVILTFITFTLTYSAGQDGLDTASDSGENVATLATGMNTQNVQTLTEATLAQMLVTALKDFQNILNEGRDFSIRSILSRDLTKDGLTLAQWDARKPAIADAHTVTRMTEEGLNWWIFQIHLPNGMYYDSDGIQNKLTPEQQAANNGWGSPMYLGSQEMGGALFDPRMAMYTSGVPDYPGGDGTTAVYMDRSFNGPANVEGRLEFTAYQTPNPYTRHRHNGPSLTLLYSMPVNDVRVVHIVNSLPTVTLSRSIHSVLASHMAKLPLTQNMTFCFFRSDGVILASSPYIDDIYQTVDYFGASLKAGVSHGSTSSDDQRLGYQLTTLDNTRQAHFNSLRNVLLKNHGTVVAKKTVDGGSTSIVEIFDQRDHFNGQTATLLRLSFDTRTVGDTSGNSWDTMLECTGDTSTSCHEFTPNGKNGTSLKLDGRGSIIVRPYLTQRVARVAATRVPNTASPGAWNSSKWFYRHTASVGGIADVIVTPRENGDLEPAMRDRFHQNQEHAVSMWVKPASHKTPEGDVPTLFSFDMSHEKSGMRFTADGAVHFDMRSYGCRTDPLPAGGLPIGEWSHIAYTASFVRSKRSCSVYVNGVLHSEGYMTFAYTVPLTRTNYTIGAGFSGEIDDVRFHNRSLTEADARSAMETGEGIYVSSRKMAAVVLGVDPFVTAGLPAYVYSIAVPYEDIVREAEAAAARLHRNLQVERSNTDKQLDRKTSATLFIVTVALLVAALMFLTFNDILTKPFAVFAMEIDSVAQIDVDGMEPQYRNSVLLEINVMSKAMCALVKNMKEFKSFMPLSMQECVAPVEEDSATTDSDPNGRNTATSGIRTAVVRGAVPYSASHQSSSSLTSESRTASHRSVYHEKARQATQLLASSLHRKKMSFIVVNVQGFHRAMHSLGEKDAIDRHQKYIQLCIDNAQARCGMPESFSGDRVLVTFNGAKSCSGHPESAADTALLMCERWQKDSLGDGINMGIASGTVRAGNIGAQSMRRYTTIGSVLPWVYGVERFGRFKDRQMVCDSLFAEMLSGRYEFRHFGVVTSAKYSSSSSTSRTCVVVSHFLDKVQCTDDEWMYQLENASKSSRNAVWNAFFEHVVKEKWDEADSLHLKHAEMHVTHTDCYPMLKSSLDAREFNSAESIGHL